MPKDQQRQRAVRGGVSDCNEMDEPNRNGVVGSYHSLSLLKVHDTEYFNIDGSFTKNIVLNKYFKSTENQQNSLIYENLCFGCGYGVFDAKGRLCNFCQFVRNGYLEDDNTSNIYENICDKCGLIFSGNYCNLCSIHLPANTNENSDQILIYNKNTKNNSKQNFKNTDNKTPDSKKIKKKLFRGLIGSLKRVKRSTTTTDLPIVQPRKLEIVHNVDGNVFRTNETFDLNRICELKRMNSSSSDQHIYGKLRINDDYPLNLKLPNDPSSKSDPTLHQIHSERIKPFSVTAPTTIKDQVQQQKISSLCGLQQNHQQQTHQQQYKHTCIQQPTANTNTNTNYYLQENVIDWMTSLRKEIHDYRSFGATTFCNPKSIPAKYEFSCFGFFDDGGSCSSTDYGSLNSHTSKTYVNDSSAYNDNFDNTWKKLFDRNLNNDQLNLTYDHYNYSRMIDNFKQNIMEKQVKLRSKRKAIYMKVDADIRDDNRDDSNLGITKTNCDRERKQDTDTPTDSVTATAVIGDGNSCTSSHESLISTATVDSVRSRRGALYQSSNRNGFYEKDSDFVNDILKAFDSIIKRDSSDNSEIHQIKNNSNNNNKNNNNSDINENCGSVSEDLENSLINDLNITDDRINKKFHSISASNIGDSTALANSSNFSKQIQLLSLQSQQEHQQRQHKRQENSCKTITIYGNKLADVLGKKINFESLIVYLALSSGINKIVLTYDPRLSTFLRTISVQKFSKWDNARLVRLFRKFCSIERKQSLENKKNRISERKQNQSQDSTVDLLQLEFPAISMTVPRVIQQSTETVKDEENIYQPIWKFKTVTNDKYINDSYGDGIGDSVHCDDGYCESESLEEDHGEWEIDDEFYFSTKVNSSKKADTDSMSIQTNASSTITGSMIFDHTSSANSVCIIYSTTQPTIRAIIYDYNRYNFDLLKCQRSNIKQSGSYIQTKNEYFVNKSPPLPAPRRRINKAGSESIAKVATSNSIPDSVQAWKFMLLNVNYLEDEEDMYVSENDFLSTKLPEKAATPPPPPAPLNKFKSHSTDNLVDVLDDKKSITESLKNIIFARGVLKLNNRQPRDRSFRDMFRRQQDTMSLYIDDDMKLKYPVFGVKLTDVELHPTEPLVPRFVVDCIRCIEEDECIKIDGLYRASGNKTAIDELKKKLTDGYIYDAKLLQNHDVHILTGLLKMFFRELKTSLINYDLLRRLPENLVDTASLEIIKEKFQGIAEPSRTTLKHLFKHLMKVASYSSENRMPASNLAIVWGPCLLSADDFSPMDIPRINTLTKVVIEGYHKIFESDNIAIK